MRARRIGALSAVIALLSACGQQSAVRSVATAAADTPTVTASPSAPGPTSVPPPTAVASSTTPSAVPSATGRPTVSASSPVAAPVANPQSPDPSSPPTVRFATGLAATALDQSSVAALVESCDKGECTRSVVVNSQGAWRRTVVDRFAWGTGGGIVGVVALDRSHLFVYGDSGLFRSADGGRSWHKSAPIRHLTLAAIDGQGLLIVCAGCGRARQDTLVAVTNHGSVGGTLLSAPGMVQVLAAAGSDYVLTSDTVAGQSLRVSRDHGSTWQILPLPATAWIGRGDLRLASAGGLGLVLVAAAEPTATTQTKSIYHSGDGGLTWSKTADAESTGFATSVVDAGPELLWRFGARAPVYRSSDGGATWTTVLADQIGDAAGRQVDGFAADGDSAWVWVRTLAGTGVDAYETHDGGTHWTETVVPVG